MQAQLSVDTVAANPPLQEAPTAEASPPDNGSTLHTDETIVDIPPQLEVVSSIDETIVDPNPVATAQEALSRPRPTSRVKTGFKGGTKRFGQQTKRFGAQSIEQSALSAPAKKPILVSLILAILPLAVCGTLYAIKDTGAVNKILLQVSKVTSKGVGKLYAMIKSPADTSKPNHTVKTPNDIKNLPPVEPPNQPAIDDKDAIKRAEKEALTESIYRKMDEYRLNSQTIKKYEEGALSAKQKEYVENMKKALGELKTKIEELKKEYQERYGEPFKE
ncbi:MAG: hypothetical protein A2W05_11630 [Candidatus Schekmanbacteria bacterium RBG_16_38_10]|uniref:Uncharacterized protein n=1 Tax=Candidatus Schekmanbacteria bacterium RBG_16_38_10 TaxID=1817879 RepID=A0A1F7RV11_9BACT|nr:MAG: hypothetical protein A2W05_11630 [Candidatus Schekmanbacteria bacterium RBG_16_38_10]